MTIRHHVTRPGKAKLARHRAKSHISRKGKKHPHKGTRHKKH